MYFLHAINSVTVNTIAECLRTDCNILGDNKKKIKGKGLV